jgi:hypothetical protein
MNRQALPGGTYQIGGGHWRLIRRIAEDVIAAEATVEDVRHLAEVAEGQAQEQPDLGQLADTIASETPFTRLADTIRQHSDLSNFIASNVINFIVAVAMALIVAAFHIEATTRRSSPPDG